MDDLTIIVPAYNEKKAIIKTLKALCESYPRAEIIMVDDGSTDGTSDLVEKLPIKLVRHRKNKGYGAAIKTGIRNAKRAKIILFDADAQHQTEDAIRIYERLKNYDMVVGSRSKGSYIEHARWFSKKLLKITVRLLIGEKFPDLNSGLRGFHTKTIKRYLHLLPNGFSASTTMSILFYQRGYDVDWIPVTTDRRIGKSSVRQVNDGLNTILLITRLLALFNPLRLFLPLSFSLFAFGILWGLIYITKGFGLSIGALFFLLTGILLFFFGILTDQVSQSRLERFEEK